MLSPVTGQLAREATMLIRKQRGFTLIEILVAVVIMAVGLLGIAGLQVVSMQQNRSALLRAQALQLGEDILDRIRANPAASYDGVALTDAPDSNPEDCLNAVCTPAQMAAYDIAQWKCSINSTAPDDTVYAGCDAAELNIAGILPNGQGSINLTGVVYTVIVQWQTGQEATPNSITLRTQID